MAQDRCSPEVHVSHGAAVMSGLLQSKFSVCRTGCLGALLSFIVTHLLNCIFEPSTNHRHRYSVLLLYLLCNDDFPIFKLMELKSSKSLPGEISTTASFACRPNGPLGTYRTGQPQTCARYHSSPLKSAVFLCHSLIQPISFILRPVVDLTDGSWKDDPALYVRYQVLNFILQGNCDLISR
jgi:hypothetical protein